MDHHIYRRDGSKYPPGEEGLISWARDFEEVNRRVNWTKLWWGGYVSTVWLGLDHNYTRQGPPLFFETMVFSRAGSERDQMRYSTENEAMDGHKIAVSLWSNPFYVGKEMFKSWLDDIRWRIRSLWK